MPFDLKNMALARTHHGRAPKSGLPLPPQAFRMGGKHFHDDPGFLRGAAADVDKLVQHADLNPRSRLLDWGCGAGRLAIGVAEQFGRLTHYHGIDAQRHLIDWADRHIGRQPGYEFTHADVENARYNRTGQTGNRRLSSPDGAYDIAYAYSVYSHLGGDDTAAYLAEFRRVLHPTGTAFVTAFVADDVPDETENPAEWGSLQWSGPLHCVLYSRRHFERMIRDAGLAIKGFSEGTETDGQSVYLLARTA